MRHARLQRLQRFRLKMPFYPFIILACRSTRHCYCWCLNRTHLFMTKHYKFLLLTLTRHATNSNPDTKNPCNHYIVEKIWETCTSDQCIAVTFGVLRLSRYYIRHSQLQNSILALLLKLFVLSRWLTVDCLSPNHLFICTVRIVMHHRLSIVPCRQNIN